MNDNINIVLKQMVETAREAKKLSQRQLSKRIGLSQSTYNDTINGKIKKPNVEILRKIAEELDLSLQDMLKVSGYNEVSSWFDDNRKSTRDYKNNLKEYQNFKYDILDWDAKKRKKAMELMKNLGSMKLHLKLIQEDAVTDYTLEEALKDIDEVVKGLEEVAKKYDYSKLPKDL